MWPQLELKYGLGPNTAIPFAFARSSIFSSQVYRGHANRPQYNLPTELVATGQIKIYQTAGYQLDQGDADVLYEIVRKLFNQEDTSGNEPRVLFNRRHLLEALGRAPGGKTRALLDASIERLFAASFEFQIPGLITGTSRLIMNVVRREDAVNQEHDYNVLIDVRLAQLFGQGRWVLLRKSERAKLGSNPLTKWLHGYYSTHREPFHIKQKTLKSLTGRGDTQDSKWLSALTTSLEELKKATGWHICELVAAGKNAGHVVVVRDEPKQKKQTKMVPSATMNATDISSLDAYLPPADRQQFSDEDYYDI